MLLSQWYPCRWTEFVRRRLVGPFRLDRAIASTLDFDFDFQRVFRVLSGLPYHIAMTWVKTIANGWATSSRLNKDTISPCIFCHSPGCDQLLHYLGCDVFCKLLQDNSEAPLAFARGMISKLALDPCDILHIKFIFVSFTTYHSLHNIYFQYMPALPQRWGTVAAKTVVTAATKFESLLGSARLCD